MAYKWALIFLLSPSIAVASSTAACEQPLMRMHYLLVEAIEHGDLEQVRIIMHSAERDRFFPAQAAHMLKHAVERFLENLHTAAATAAAWKYFGITAGVVSALAITLIGWRYYKRPRPMSETPPPTLNPLPATPNTTPATTMPHGTLPDDEEDEEIPQPHNLLIPDPIRAVSDSASSLDDDSHHDSSPINSNSSSSENASSSAEPSINAATTDSSSSSKTDRKKKKRWWHRFKKNNKVSPEPSVNRSNSSTQLNNPSMSAMNDDPEPTVACCAPFALFSFAKNKRSKHTFQQNAERRMAIVQELLADPLCNPDLADGSGSSVIELVHQKLSTFPQESWEGQLVADLYMLLQSHSKTQGCRILKHEFS